MRGGFIAAAPLVASLAAFGCSSDDGGGGGAPTPELTALSLDGPAVAFIGTTACFTATFEGAEAPGLEWFFEPSVGEGEAGTGTYERCATWERRGEYRVFVSGGGLQASVTVPVVPTPNDPAPTHSSTIVFDAERDRVWVVNPDNDSVAVIDATSLERIAEIPVDAHPRTLALSGDRVAVACQDAGSLVLLDAAAMSVAASVALGPGSGPYGVTADPRGGRFFVALQFAGALAVVDAANANEVARLPLAFDARGLTANAAGAVLVTRWRGDEGGATVWQVDASDAAAPALVGEIRLPVHERVNSEIDHAGVASFLNQVVFAPGGQRALVPALKANTVTGTHRTGEELTDDSTVRAILRELVIPAPGTLGLVSFEFSFDDADYASAVTYTAAGDRFYVAQMGAEAVIQMEPLGYNVAGSVDAHIAPEFGAAIQGIVLDPAGERLFAKAFAARSVRVYDVRDLSSPAPLLGEVATVSSEALPADVVRGQRIFYGSRDPRMSRTSYVSCASCHLDGSGDNLTWDFTQRGEGLRNTISLLGRGGDAEGPLHWSANFDEVQDFEHDIRGGQGGVGFLSDEVFGAESRDTPLGGAKVGLSGELDALAAYVNDLRTVGVSPYRKDGDAEWEAAVARGRDLFESEAVGCAECHAAPRYTDSGWSEAGEPNLHDVGTLSEASGQRLGGELPGLDTPHLRGLFRTPPYLHDGSAATLRDVLTTRNPSDQHGVTSQLDEAGLTDLETFLLSLDDLSP